MLLLAITVGMSPLINAQNAAEATNTKQQLKKHKTPNERSENGADEAEKKLGLNADQKAQWQTAALKRITANQPLQEKMKSATTFDEKKLLRSQIKANNEVFEKTVNSFLTEEQKTTFEQIKKDKKAANKAKHAAGD